MPPPFSAPTAPKDFEVFGVVRRKLSTETNCSGADIILDELTTRNKDKIKNLRLNWIYQESKAAATQRWDNQGGTPPGAHDAVSSGG